VVGLHNLKGRVNVSSDEGGVVTVRSQLHGCWRGRGIVAIVNAVVIAVRIVCIKGLKKT